MGKARFSHGLTILTGVFLLVVSKGFLINNPLWGSGILMLFALLSLAFAYLVAEIFIYPAAFLLSLAYFLIAYRGLPYFSSIAPALSIPLVVLLAAAAYAFERLKIFDKASHPLDYTASVIGLFFLGILLFRNYPPGQRIYVFAFYSLFYFWQFRRAKAGWLYGWLYPTLVCFSLSVFFSLGRISEANSLGLIILFMIYMYLGTGQKQWWPASIVGFCGLLLVPWYIRTNLPLLMIIQFLYSFHFYRLYTLSKRLSLSKREENIFLALSFLFALVYLFIFTQRGFPVNFFCLGLALAYLLLYLAGLWQNRLESRKKIITFTGLLALFINLVFFESLLIYSPVYEITWYLVLAIPFIWFFFWLGYLGRWRGRYVLSQTVYVIQFLTILLSFLIPLELSHYSLDFICMLAFGYLLSTLLFFLISEERKFFFLAVLAVSFLYYYLISNGPISAGGSNLFFLLPGFFLLGLGMWSQKKNSHLAEVWYFGWITLSAIFLVKLHYGAVFCIYGLSVCALLYCLAYGYTQSVFPGLGKVFYWMANSLSLVAVIVWIWNKNIPAGIFLGLILSMGHFFMAYQSKKNWHIYTACLALAAAWWLFLQAEPWRMVWAFPLALFLYSCSFRSFPKQGEKAFKLAGHFWVATVTLLALISPSTGNWFFLSLLIYAVGYLILSWLCPDYEYLFLSAAFFSLSYYFGLHELTGLSGSMRLQYFFLSPFTLGLVGYIVKKKRGEPAAQPVFDVAVLVALTTSVMALFYGNLEVSLKLLLLSSVFYMFLAIHLARELYLYLGALTLGLLAYNFLSVDHQRVMIDLLVYSFYLILFLALFFFFSPPSNNMEAKSPSQHSMPHWKRRGIYLVLLLSFPCLLIPLYSQKIINYPGSCSQCHYMRPYADDTSSHQKADCATCHYASLIGPPNRKKVVND